MMEFILSKVACISLSRALLEMTIISGQHQEISLCFERTDWNFYKSSKNLSKTASGFNHSQRRF